MQQLVWRQGASVDRARTRPRPQCKQQKVQKTLFRHPEVLWGSGAREPSTMGKMPSFHGSQPPTQSIRAFDSLICDTMRPSATFAPVSTLTLDHGVLQAPKE